MSYVMFVAGFLVALFLCVLFYRSEIKQLTFNAEHLQSDIYSRQCLYFGVLRREFFNGLIDSHTILELDMELKNYAEKVKKMSEIDFHKEKSFYFKKYPHIYDFDLIGNRHDIKYYDLLNDMEAEVINNLYLDIVKCIVIFTRIIYGTNNDFLSYITDIDAIKTSVRKYEDNRLGLLAQDAIRRKRYFHQMLMGGKYEDMDYTVEYIDRPSISTKIGIYVKKTDEYLIYESFVDDKLYETFYRSNQGFIEETPIYISSVNKNS